MKAVLVSIALAAACAGGCSGPAAPAAAPLPDVPADWPGLPAGHWRSVGTFDGKPYRDGTWDGCSPDRSFKDLVTAYDRGALSEDASCTERTFERTDPTTFIIHAVCEASFDTMTVDMKITGNLHSVYSITADVTLTPPPRKQAKGVSKMTYVIRGERRGKCGTVR